MAGGTTLSYLSDGQAVILPEDPHFYDANVRVPAPWVTQTIGQLGLWHAQRILFVGIQSTTANITSATWSSLALQSELIDNYDMHSTSTNASQVQPPETSNLGVHPSDDQYLCIGYVPQNSSVTSSVYIAGINNNYNSILTEGTKVPGITGHAVDGLVVDLQPMRGNPFDSPAKFFEVAGWQNTGGTVATVVSAKTPSFSVQWQGAARAFTTTFPTNTPHTWIPQDQVANGSGFPPYPAGPVSPGSAVDINVEISYPVYYMNSPVSGRVTSQGSSQTIASGGTFVSVQMPTATLNTWGMWSSGANTKLTAIKDGLYLVGGFAAVAETSTKAGYRAVRLLQTFAAGGTATFGGASIACGTGTGTTGTALYAVELIQMSAGDTVEVQFAHTNGSSLSVLTGSGNSSRLFAIWQCF